jgi:hypothetical protein
VGRDSASLQMDAWLARARRFDRSPDLVRARLLARARCAVLATDVAAPVAPAEVTVSLRPRRRQAVLAGAVVLASAAAGARASLHLLARRLPAEEPPPLTQPILPARARGETAAAPALEPAAREVRTIHRARLAHSGRDTYLSEVDLLQFALAAYERHDLPDALGLVAEYDRRFPRGRLAEEAEALRIGTLAGLERAGEARAAFQAFEARFPHSVALPRLRQALGSSGRSP